MTLKDVRDTLSRMFAQDRSLEEKECNHVLIEDVDMVQHIDYMLKDSDVEEDEDDYDEDEDYWDYDDADSELDEESWEDDDDDSELEEQF